MSCLICLKPAKDKLCKKHICMYIWDEQLQGIRLRKKNNGSSSRYTNSKYHLTETKLVKIIETIFGKKNVITSWHPLWAHSSKKALFEYDIYVPSHNLLIEYNGIQHYIYTPFFQKRKSVFIKQQKRDRLKKKLAKDNGYTLIIFKYDEPIILDYVKNKVEV